MRLELKMAHGHQPGWAPEEIGLFVDSKCRGGVPLPVPGEPVVDGDVVRVKVTTRAEFPLGKGELHYAVEPGLRSARKWVTVPGTLEGDNVIAPKPPQEANTWFLTVTDKRGAMVSTVVMISGVPRTGLSAFGFVGREARSAPNKPATRRATFNNRRP